MYFMSNLMELIRSGECKDIKISFHGDKVELEFTSKKYEDSGLQIDCWTDISNIENEINLLIGEKTVDNK